MAEARYKSVRERALQVIEDQLNTISTEDGYNNTVDAVVRGRAVPQRLTHRCSIFMMPGSGYPGHGSTPNTYENFTLELWFFKMRTEDLDLEFNLFEVDIKRALICNTLTDATASNPARTGVDVEWEETIPLYTEEEGIVRGIMRFRVRYFYSENDPRLWGDSGDALVEVKE